MEQSLIEGKPIIFNFVDFKKAFDSLDWDTMWKVMEAQGVPTKIVSIIKELYNNASISVRLNLVDNMAPKFQQKVGIRQACFLSPAIFILILNFAMNAYEEACEELGLSEDSAWLGYADDLAIKSTDESKAEMVFHQLQAACAFVGLHCNTDKTECLAMGICKPEANVEQASKERIQVTFGNGKFEGWLVDWAARDAIMDKDTLKYMDFTHLQPAPSHLIIYDEPDEKGS